ncbi:alpha/beta fold hydrolase [Streptomyces sp. NPDC005708]|uniref:alpha/beta fold hydrolase n=1 Tax=Streptomyces sp. NPDC005708 TaxID=3154564 RepID=UPI0033F12DFC
MPDATSLPPADREVARVGGVFYGDTGDMGDGSGMPVVLLHGFLFDQSMWRAQVAALSARGHRVITVDLPGFGASAVPEEPATMSTYSTAVAAIIDQLALPPVALVGYSMGGQVTLDTYAARPDLVARVVLVDTVAHTDLPEVAQGRRDLAARLEREGVRQYAEEFLPQLLRLDGASAATVIHARTMMQAADPVGAARALRARADRPDYGPVLDACPFPVLIVVGEHDPFDQGRFGAGMAERAPCGTLEVVVGVGHTPPLEAPDVFTGLLARFLGN